MPNLSAHISIVGDEVWVVVTIPRLYMPYGLDFLRLSTFYVADEGWLAGEPGFEPGLTESESVGLPLTYSPTAAREGRR
jgi:hypothetical protein